MTLEELLPFLLNQFVPEGRNEDDLPIWVKTLREKLSSTVFKKFKKFDEDADNIDISGFVSGAAKHLHESVDALSSKLDIQIDQDVS